MANIPYDLHIRPG